MRNKYYPKIVVWEVTWKCNAKCMNDFSEKIGQNWNGCQAGMYVLGLGSDGTVRGCLSQQIDKYIEGNIRERSLIDIWNNPDSFSYNRNFDLSCLGGYCKECKHAQICRGGCTRAATTESDCRCSRFCLYRLEQDGFSNDYQSRVNFSKEEIAELYNQTKQLPSEFYDKYTTASILNKF